MPEYDDKSCVFCGIIRGRVPAAKVYEDDNLVAFLDSRPLFPGHLLVCPRNHYNTFPELPPALVRSLFLKSQQLTTAVERAMEAEGTFLAINNRVSQSVPHLHLHIVPRRKKDGLKGFFWPRNKYRDDDHLENVRRAIVEHMQSTNAELPHEED
jgi:histidine triad (HIT) family protein